LRGFAAGTVNALFKGMTIDTNKEGMLENRTYGMPDLQEIAQILASVSGRLPAAYLPGKSALADIVAGHLGCSRLRAESIVDQLEDRGFVQFHKPIPGMNPMKAYWSVYVTARSMMS
jgi:hypothetical protein